jgi:hypothetical protein
LQRAVGGIDRGEFGANLLPIAIQLFSQQLRERSHRSLAHLRFVDREGDDVVAADMDEGVQFRRCGGGFQLAAFGKMESDEQAARGCDTGFQETAAAEFGIRESWRSCCFVLYFTPIRICRGLILGGQVNGVANGLVGPAAADVAVHGLVDIGVGGVCAVFFSKPAAVMIWPDWQ